jgi:hypothetical protein
MLYFRDDDALTIIEVLDPAQSLMMTPFKSKILTEKPEDGGPLAEWSKEKTLKVLNELFNAAQG